MLLPACPDGARSVVMWKSGNLGIVAGGTKFTKFAVSSATTVHEFSHPWKHFG